MMINNMYIKNISFILIFFFLGGCINKNNKDYSDIININPHESKEYINLSEIVDSIKCIKLQTDPTDVMGRVREVIVKKKYIYAIDVSQQIVFVFDREGRFVSKLNKRGQGPDEYVHMGPVFIDESEDYIELINFRGEKTTKIKYSNISFELIEISPFPDLNYNSCKKNNDMYYFSTQQMDNLINGEKTNADLVVSCNNNLKTLFKKNIKTNNASFSPNIESFAKNDNDELFISLMYNNTFYNLKEGEPIPIFSVDFGKYGINNSIGSQSIEKQLKYIKGINGLASFPVLNLNNKDIMSFSYYFKQDGEERMYHENDFRQYIKFNNKIYHTKKIKNDITNFPNRIYISSYFFNCAHEVWHENYIVDVIIPRYYFSDETESVFSDEIGEVTVEDNPIIVMMKLRNNNK